MSIFVIIGKQINLKLFQKHPHKHKLHIVYVYIQWKYTAISTTDMNNNIINSGYWVLSIMHICDEYTGCFVSIINYLFIC